MGILNRLDELLGCECVFALRSQAGSTGSGRCGRTGTNSAGCGDICGRVLRCKYRSV